MRSSTCSLLFCAVEIVSSWMRSDNASRHQACLKTLGRLRIFQRQEGGLFVLQKSFARHIQQALGSGVHRFFVAISPDVRLALPEGRKVDYYASSQWEVCDLCRLIYVMHWC